MSLRQTVIRGGAVLAVRQGISMAIGVGGVLILTRQIGPSNYGLYAAAVGIFAYLQSLTTWGLDIYLVREADGSQREIYDQAFTMLAVLGIVTLASVSVAMPLIGALVGMDGFTPVLSLMILLLPAVLVGRVGLGRLEQRLDYRSIALIELGGQLLYYAVALPLAVNGYGVRAPLYGWAAQRFAEALAFLIAASYVPRFYWNRALARSMATYGLSYSSSLWVWQLRNLVNPVIVGRFAGADAVGYVALAIRFVEYLSFVKSATWRISIAALGRIQQDSSKLSAAISEGMRLQLLALAPLLVGFSWIAPHTLPRLVGSSWAPALAVFPFIAVAYLANAVFSLHSAALYVRGKNMDVTRFHFIHIALFAGSAFVLVPQFGEIGYGLAEGIGLASYLAIHRYTSRQVPAPSYRLALPWCAGFGLALFHQQLGWWAGLGVMAVTCWPVTWNEIGSVVRTLRGRTANVA